MGGGKSSGGLRWEKLDEIGPLEMGESMGVFPFNMRGVYHFRLGGV